jgi:hypothetical protein
MREFRRTISTIAGIAALAALIAGSACLAFAQESNSQTGGWTRPNLSSSASALPEPEVKTPLDVAGCWSGGIDDKKTGEGTGFIFFVQEGKKLVDGTGAGFSFTGFGSESGSLTGHVTNKSFVTSFKEKPCKVNVRGRIVSGDLVGTYSIKKKCTGVIPLKGTFDYTFDASGDSCD